MNVMNTIRRCTTVRQILAKLDDEYRPKSHAAATMARRKFYSMRVTENEDIAKYIRKFEECSDHLIDAGHPITDIEKIQQLIASLTKEYDIAVTNYYAHVRQHGESFQTLKRMLIDRYERDFDDKKLMARYSDTAKTDPETEKTGNQRRDRLPKPNPTVNDPEAERAKRRFKYQRPLTCKNCEGFGHYQSDCPSVLKENKDTEKTSTETPTGGAKEKSSAFEREKSKAQVMMVNSSTAKSKNTPHKEKNHVFLLDSGAYKHMTKNWEYLTDVRKLPHPEKLSCASRSAPLEATHSGEMLIKVKNRFGEERSLLLKEVLYVQQLDVDLLSENIITHNGQFHITFTKDYADVINTETNEVTLSAKRSGNGKYVEFIPVIDDRKPAAYPVQLPEPENEETATPIEPATKEKDENDEKWAWHRRMGHASGKYLKILTENSEGMPNIKFSTDDFRDCQICMKAKSTILGHHTARRRPTRRLEIVSSDILGPFTPGKNGEKYVVTFIDNFSKYTCIALLKNKSDVAAAFARYHKNVESKFPGEKLHMLRADRAKEYINGTFRDYCNAAGIEIEETSPYSPQLNGTAERMNRTLTEKLRALLYESNLDYSHWPYAVEMATFLINRSPTRTNPNCKTPFELWNGYKPDLQYLKTFGCTAFRHIPEEVRKQQVTAKRRKGEIEDAKLCPRAEKRILVGYTATGYVVLDTQTGKTTSTCDVRFLEGTEKQNEQIISETETAEIPEPVNASENPAPAQERSEYSPTTDHSYAAFAVLNGSSNRRTPQLLEECVPKSFAEVKYNPFENDWRRAIDTELTAMETNKVFEVQPWTPGIKTIDSKWLFTIKYHDNGEPYPKARLVARGFRDRSEYQIFETYSPVVNLWLIRWALAIANRRNLKITKYDVSTAFLNAEINKPTYLSIPEGFAEPKTKSVLKLHRSLYGLKTSSKNWYDTIDDTIKQLGFLRSRADRCLYYKKGDGLKISLLLVYVDDILLLTDDDEIREQTTAALENQYRITYQHNPTFFVGFEIRRDEEKKEIYLSQTNYIRRILQRFQLDDCNPQRTPMETNLHLTRPENGVDDREFRAMIGALLYVARGTRPDIAYAVNALSRIQNSSTITEKNYVRRIFKYLKGTIEYALPIVSTGQKIDAYVDASYAPDVTLQSTEPDINLGKSVTGYLLRIFGDPIVGGVKKQTIVASSSTAAEIIAIHDALDDIRVAYAIMHEIFSIAEAITIWEDNTSAARIVMGGEQKRNRATLIKCYDVLQAVADQEITLQTVPSTGQLADFLTKPLDRDKFSRNTRKIFFPKQDTET